MEEREFTVRIEIKSEHGLEGVRETVVMAVDDEEAEKKALKAFI